MAEAVMMGIAPKIGRNQAHEIVFGAAGKAWDKGITLREALIDDVKVTAHLSLKEIDRLIDPANYTGSAGNMITRVLKKVAHD